MTNQEADSTELSGGAILSADRRGAERFPSAQYPFWRVLGEDSVDSSLATVRDVSATGIGLLNLRRWGARWWTYVAWLKIALPCLLWAYYIVAVAPTFSENMAKNVITIFQQQNVGARARLPTLGDLTRIYSIMNSIVAVAAIVVSSIYPAISLWLLSRPGVKAAIVDKPLTEPELP